MKAVDAPDIDVVTGKRLMSERLPHEKGFHVSWDQIHRDARALAWRLDGKGPDNGQWKAVVAITRGDGPCDDSC